MSSLKHGTRLAAVAVNHAAICSTSAALFGPPRTSTNPNMLTHLKYTYSATVQTQATSEGQKPEFSGSAMFRLPKSLDFVYHGWFGVSVPRMRLKHDPKMNVLATLKLKKDWAALILRNTRLLVQDLTVSEADWFAALVHAHVSIRSAHRENVDILMGNTASWLTPAGYNAATGFFDLVGDDNTIYVPLPLLAMTSGFHARPFVSGAAIFNDIRIEIDFSDLGDIVEITNGECGTVAFDGTPNGRAAGIGDIETCNGTCPEIRDGHVIIHGAVGSTDEKKLLSTMTASQQIKVYSKTMYQDQPAHADSTIEVRSSSAAQALYSCVLNTTFGRPTNDTSVYAGSGQSGVESMQVCYESTIYYHGSNALSVLNSVSNTHDVGHEASRLPFLFFLPFDHVVDSDQIRGVVELGKISQVIVTHTPNAAAAAAAQGFDVSGNPIPAAQGHSSCQSGVQGSPGVAQRYTAAVLLVGVHTIKYQKSAVQLVL